MRLLLTAAVSTILLVSAAAPSIGQTASYAPIDCAKASAPAEATICGNYALGQDEARVATLYGVITSLVAMGQHGDIMDAQQKWLVRRNACKSDVECLTGAYKARIAALSNAFDTLAKRGPF